MSKISPQDIQKLARLSAVSLSDEQTASLQADLTQILEYVEQLQAVDTDGVEPMYQAHDLYTVTRTDEVIDYGVSQSDLLKNAHEKMDGSIVVPRVLE